MHRRDFLKNTIAAIGGVALSLDGSAQSENGSNVGERQPNDAAKADRPNFVFVLSEAQGWTNSSVQMDPNIPNSRSDFYRTPNLERLSESGIRFSDFYAPSPRCTPSRASFFTGKSPAKLHMTFVSERGPTNPKILEPNVLLEMPLEETTIAELLKTTGYATAHFGKWHVGRIHPSRHGFDESDGATSNGGPQNVQHPNPKQAYAITASGIDFMTRQVEAAKPFYLQISHYAARRADDATEDSYRTVLGWPGAAEGDQAGQAACLLDLDITIGMILNKLREIGIADNTFVIYSTDHGTPGWNRPLTNGKGTVSEGGLRVPLIISGPGIDKNSFSNVRTSGVDLFPTIAQLARVKQNLPKGLEGGSLVPLLTNARRGKVKRDREELIFHVPHYDKDSRGPASVILLGKYKLIRIYETGKRLLFDLSTDISERNDLADIMPEKVEELDQRMTEYLKEVNAQMPRINPNYDPDKPLTPDERQRGRRDAGRNRKDGERRGDRGGGENRRGRNREEGGSRQGLTGVGKNSENPDR
ncbi:MAG: sulfatase [Phycisphaerales bacterium]|nr:MAG: sulfatase [Phycisphaerales bacterium]